MSGQIIEYFAICPREAWFAYHGIRQEHESPLVELGKIVDELYSRKINKSHIRIGNSEIDFIRRENGKILVYEIKKSRALKEAHKLQLMFYLYILDKMGVKASGVLWYPKERYKELVILDKESIEKAIVSACELVQREKPPEPIMKPICKHCSYYEYCWV